MTVLHSSSVGALHKGSASPILGSPAFTPIQSGTNTPVLGSPALTPMQSPRASMAARSSTFPCATTVNTSAMQVGNHSGNPTGALAHPAQSTTAVFSIPAQSVSTPSARILVYGDSLTAGMPSFEPYAKTLVSKLAEQGISVEVVGCGLCSTTAVEMAHSLDSPHIKDCTGRTGPGLRRLMAERGPFDLVMIMAGTNDLVLSSVDQALASLKNMHKSCHAAGVPTVAISIPESSVTGTSKYPEAAHKWHAANRALADWARSERDITYVDSAQLISFNANAVARGLWEPDELHFSASGSRVLGSGLAPLIASLLHSTNGKEENGRLRMSKTSSCISVPRQCGYSSAHLAPATPFTPYTTSGGIISRRGRFGGA